MAEQKGQVPAWVARRAVENKAQIEKLVQTYRIDWGTPVKPLLAESHALLEDEFVADVLCRNPKHRAERALIELLRQEVLRRLSTSELAAEGVQGPFDQAAPIPAEHWPDMQVDFEQSTASLGATVAAICVWRPPAAIEVAALALVAVSAKPVETPAQLRERAKRDLATWTERYMAAERAAGRKVSADQLWDAAKSELAPLKVTRQMAREQRAKHGPLKPGEKTGRRKSPT